MHSHLAKMLGQYIFEKRIEKDFTQYELAKLLEFSPQFLGRAERGEVCLPNKSIVKCIKYLELSAKKITEIYRVSALLSASDLLERANKNRRPRRKSA